jgi:cytochrome c oxidase cbb3-type subunit I/II
MQVEQFHYDNRIVRNFAIATIIFGVVGMLVGVWIALLMVFPGLNVQALSVGSETIGLSFGRLRPLHTNAVIFAFVGNGIFMGYYYAFQRLLKTRMASDLLSRIHFWGWQLIIVAAAALRDGGQAPRRPQPLLQRVPLARHALEALARRPQTLPQRPLAVR